MTIFLAFLAGIGFGAVATIGVGLWIVCGVASDPMDHFHP